MIKSKAKGFAKRLQTILLAMDEANNKTRRKMGSLKGNEYSRYVSAQDLANRLGEVTDHAYHLAGMGDNKVERKKFEIK